MPVIDSDAIRRLERIIIDGISYSLHVNVYKGAVHSAVIGLSPAGTYLPAVRWAEGVCAADAVLGDTSDISRWHAYPYCALFIRQENGPVQIRTREHYEIDVQEKMN